MAGDPLWQHSGLTVVLLPSDERGESLLELARTWTRLKLLRPSIWVEPKGLVAVQGEPPRLAAHVLGSSSGDELHEVEVDLFEQLARQGLTGTRLLVVRPLAEQFEFDEAQDAVVDVVGPYLKRSIPERPKTTDAVSDQIPFLLINLLVAPTEHVTEWVDRVISSRQPFNAHFVASAEDRSSPHSGDAFVRYAPGASRFNGVTMMHIATIGGLWQGLPQGGYELVSETAWEGNRVFVSRVFASAILTDGLIQRACARVLRRAGSAGADRSALTLDVTVRGTYPIPDSEIDAWVDFMVEQTFSMRDSALDYRPAVTRDAPGRTRLTLLRQLGEFLRFSGDKLVRIPYYVWLAVYRRLARTSNAVFQADGQGASFVDERDDIADPRDLELLRRYDEIARVKEQADRTLVSPILESVNRTSPELWSDLRTLVFAMLDGSSQERFGIKRTDAGWPVFSRIQTLFTDPAETVTVADPERPGETLELSWMALEQATSIMRALAGSIGNERAELESLLSTLVRINQDKDLVDADLERLERERPAAVERETAAATAADEEKAASTADEAKAASTADPPNPGGAEPSPDEGAEPAPDDEERVPVAAAKKGKKAS